jgi:hypothetical protein
MTLVDGKEVHPTQHSSSENLVVAIVHFTKDKVRADFNIAQNRSRCVIRQNGQEFGNG